MNFTKSGLTLAPIVTEKAYNIAERAGEASMKASEKAVSFMETATNNNKKK